MCNSGEFTMKHSYALSSATTDADSVPHLTGRWRILAQAGWVIFALGCLSLFVWSLPQVYRIYAAFNANTAPPPGVVRAGLAALGISERLYVIIRASSIAAVAFIFLAIGALIFWRKSDELPALIFSLQLLLFGTIFVMSTPLATFSLSPPVEFIVTITFASFFISAYLLPDGRFVPNWTRWLVVVWVTDVAGQSLFSGTLLDTNTWPPFLSIPLTLLLAGSCIGALVYRYRRVSGPIQRQQLKWIVFGLAVTIGFFLAYWTPISLLPSLARSASATALYELIGETILVFSFALMPLAMGIAILRYRLWDIDPLVNRILVYGALTASVISIYALVVGYFAAIFQLRDNPVVSLLAAGIVAVLFQPLRELLQRGVNRLMFGRRDDPYAVISGLGRRLEATLTPDALLHTIVSTVREALKLPYAAIRLRENNHFRTAVEEGSSQEELIRLSISYQTEQVGELVLAPRAPGEDFSSVDRHLLEDLARQASMAIHAVRLTQNLQRLNAELQQARVQLVTAREEERRRLARDLHDDFGSILASLNLRAGAIRSMLRRDPLAADAVAAEQQETIRSTIANLRRLVHDLRPPVLDERGLGAALSELAGNYSASSVQDYGNGIVTLPQIAVELAEPLPPLPAAVEVAAYRILQEALTNVVRHAGARACLVRLSIQDEWLQLEVIDDGAGLPEAYQAGVGILSMHERAAELGGRCKIERVATGGTRMVAYLPIGSLK
jgi:signal transduction histidine kinase